MKIAIDKGHLRGKDQGAVAIGNENNMNLATGDKVIAKLKALGHEVLDVISQIGKDITVNESLTQRVSIANNWGADLYVSIHANAGGGHGTEVWIGSESGRAIATRIVNNIAALGYTNRGVKVQGSDSNPHIYVLNYTNMKALLVEQCFVDSQIDMNGWNDESMANAIVAGITGQSVQAATLVQQSVQPTYPDIDHTIQDNPYVTLKLPNGLGYVESVPEKGRLNIHLDKYNYISIQDDPQEGNRVWITTRTKGSKDLI